MYQISLEIYKKKTSTKVVSPAWSSQLKRAEENMKYNVVIV